MNEKNIVTNNKASFMQTESSQKIISIILIIAIIITGYSLFSKQNKTKITDNSKIIKKVSIQVINKNKDHQSVLKSVGNVIAETKVNVVALTNGTLRNIYFEIGDKVSLNQILGQMYSDASLTALNNAQTNLGNQENSLLSVKRISTETIIQTELGIEQAKVGLLNSKKSIIVAELGLKTAEDKLNNANNLREKGNLDAKNNAIISFNGYLNTTFNALDQVGNLINESNPNLINPLLGAKDQSTIRKTQIRYKLSLDEYNKLKVLNPNVNSIATDMQKIVKLLSLNEEMLNNTIDLLNNTVTGANYPEAYLANQKSIFINLRAIMVSSENSAENILQKLNTIPLNNEFEMDNLTNAVKASEVQLELAQNAKNTAELSLKNARLGLDRAHASKDQQITGAQNQINNARGQLNLSLVQTGNLNIKAPIGGTITAKYVELGTEINPGQKIAEISQTDNLKIIVNLSPADVYKIKLGQEVLIQNMHKALITNISPAADPVTKKIKIEILFNNSENLLLPGTFVDITIKLNKIKKTNPDSVFVPLRAVNITQNEKFVFVAKNGIAKKRTVETGTSNGALLEILSGLKNTDELIIDGAKSLEDEDQIEVSNF